MPVNKLSSLNQKVISNQASAKKEVEKPANNVSKKIDKKKLAVGIGAAVGISALVVGGILYTRHGKANPKLQEGIKNFIDSNGNRIEGIKLDKGKAVASDGSMFSGIMETITKSGKKVSIKYQDGFMTQSNIDGKLYKKFENISIPSKTGENFETLTRNQGTRIIKYDSKGDFDGMFEHLYYDNGKIKRTVSETKATDFFENGKIQAQEVRIIREKPNEDGFIPKTLDEYTTSDSAKLYNQEGKLTDEITGQYADRKIIKHLPDGSKVELSKVGYLNNERLSSTTLVSERKYNAGKAKFYGSDGKLKEEIEHETRWGEKLIIKEYGEDYVSRYTIISLNQEGKIESINVMGQSAFALYADHGFFGEKGNNITAYIEKLKQIISNAKKLNIDGADKFSELLSEFLKKFE